MLQSLAAILNKVQNIYSQVGLKTDPADPAGSLHAKVGDVKAAVNTLPNSVSTYIAIPSSTLRASADPEHPLVNTTTYTKVKEIVVNVAGAVRVSFDLAFGSSTPPVYGQIYKNGVAVGTERSTSSTSYTTYTQDISVAKGDAIQIYLKTQSSTSAAYVRNFRLYWDYSNNTYVTQN